MVVSLRLCVYACNNKSMYLALHVWDQTPIIYTKYFIQKVFEYQKRCLANLDDVFVAICVNLKSTESLFSVTHELKLHWRF